MRSFFLRTNLYPAWPYYRGIPITGDIWKSPNDRVRANVIAKLPSHFVYNIARQLSVNHVSYMSKIGYGYSRKEFTHLATDFAISLEKKGDAEPPFGNSRFNGYKARHPQLTLTKPQKLSVVRAKAISAAVLQEYFT